MSAPAARLHSYTLKQDIVLETRDPTTGEVREEVLKSAGTTVFIRPVMTRDLRVFDKHGDAMIAAMIELMKRVVKLEPEEIENMDAEDFEGLGEFVGSPARSSHLTGQTL